METALEVGFADGKYRFWLPVTRAIELERKLAPLTIAEMHSRLLESCGLQSDGSWVYVAGRAISLEAVREVIRIALIGGNCGHTDEGEIEVGPQLAKELVDSYVFPERPLDEAFALATGILDAAVRGIQLKKEQDEAAPKPESKRSTKAKS